MSRCLVLLGALALLAAAPLAAGPGSWTPLGPEGGSIVRLAASPAAPGTVWAVSPLGRIFKTTDGATIWKPVPSLQARGVVDIIPDPSNASIVYAWSFREGYLKSTDGGRSWSAAFEGLQKSLYALTIAPSRPSTLYALSQDQLFKSTDGGSHWSAVTELHPWSLAVSPTDPDTLLAVVGDFDAGSLLLRSRDGGAHWVEVVSLPSQLLYTIAFDPYSSTVLYASVLGGDFIRSDDEGETWIAVEPEPRLHFSAHDWEIDPHSPGTLWLSGYDGETRTLGLWRSDDRGAHWILVYSGDLPVQDIAVDLQAGLLVGDARLGALRSRDRGLHWSPAHRGFLALMVDKLAVSEDGTVWSGAAANVYGPASLLWSRDGGATWEELRPAGLFGLRVHGIAPSPLDPETVHVASYGGVYTTEDGGNTWTLQKEGLRSGESLVDIAVAPSRPSTLYVVGGLPSGVCGEGSNCLVQSLVFRSNDGGGRWRRTRLQLPPFDDWESLLIHPKRPGTVWIGGHGLYRSLDAGVTWMRLGSGLQGKVTDLVLDPSAPDTLYAAVLSQGSGNVFRSRDGGVSWQPASLGLPGAEIRNLAVDPARPATIYAATSAGIAVTDNGGKRWRMLGGTKVSPAYSVAVDPSDPRTVYAGTDAGVFVLTRTDL
jgi:photosystem II stability/assembly factor-like uncharacterized protein